MTELDMLLSDDGQAIAEWIKEHQRGDIFDQYERYVCHTARMAKKGLGEGEPLDFDAWINS